MAAVSCRAAPCRERTPWGEMEEERLTAASKAMAMMRRMQKEKAEVQMQLRRFAAEIDQLHALIAVEERDAEAEEEIFRSAGRTLLPYKEEQLDPKQINCIASCS